MGEPQCLREDLNPLFDSFEVREDIQDGHNLQIQGWLTA
jgi:hypothetical protein